MVITTASDIFYFAFIPIQLAYLEEYAQAKEENRILRAQEETEKLFTRLRCSYEA